jgi:hypothetical protein
MDLYDEIKDAVNRGHYALRPHVVVHMLSEGFYEENIREAIENGRIWEIYEEENRCLIIGQFKITEKTSEHLHVVIDFWSEHENIEWIDIVTVYIPRRPHWETPFQRGGK